MEDIYNGNIDGLHILKPKVYEDNRGYFMETFRKSIIEEHGLNANFLQENESKSRKGVLRGLHFQTDIHSQAKLVRVVQGSVWDVAVDLREGSPTYGQWHGVELTEENKLQFYVPRGFAHGFVVLSNTAIFQYKCDNYYKKEAEAGIHWDSPSLGIEWPIDGLDIQLSEKDEKLPRFSNYKKNK